MSSFPVLFAHLCGREPSFYHPSSSLEVEEASRNISGALLKEGAQVVAPHEVKPLFDRVRSLYEAELGDRVQGRCSDLPWFEAMDAYLRPLVSSRPGISQEAEAFTRSPKSELPVLENAPCDVCRTVLAEAQNEIVFCDSCNICVHQACYGVRKIPAGDWFCSPCQQRIKQPACALCPKQGGAMKSTSNGRQWAHINCAWWIKEVKIEFPRKMESINITNIPNSRWNMECSVCQVKYGVCIECMDPSCTVVYHVTCALDTGLTMDMRSDPKNKGELQWVTYCKKHSSKEKENPEKKQGIAKINRRKTSTPRKKCISSAEHNEEGNDEFETYFNKYKPIESDSTNDSSSDGFETDSTTTDSSSASEEPHAKRVKFRQPYYKQKNLPSRKPDLTTNGKPMAFDAALSTFETPRSKRKISLSSQQDGAQKKLDRSSFELKAINQKQNQSPSNHCCQQSNASTSSFVSTNSGSNTSICCTEHLYNTNNKQKNLCSLFKAQASQSGSKECASDFQNLHANEGNSGDSTHCQSCSSRPQHTNARQDGTQFVPSVQKNSSESQPNVAQKETCFPSTSSMYQYASADHPTADSFVQPERANSQKATSKKNAVNYEQLTKFITVHFKSVPSKEALKLERKIISMCLKSRERHLKSQKK